MNAALTIALPMLLCVVQVADQQYQPSIADIPAYAIPNCGPAAMAVVFRLLDTSFTDSELAALTDAAGQTSFLDMQALAEEKGLEVDAVTGSLADLLTLERPAILHLDLSTGETPPINHFVVLTGPHDLDEVLIVDATGTTGVNGPMDIETLLSVWTGQALVIGPGTPLWRTMLIWALPFAACLVIPYVILTRIRRRNAAP